MRVINTNEFDAVINSGVVLVDFYADWCGPCRMMTPVLENVAEALGDQATIVKVNCDNHPSLAQRFNVMSIPNLLLFKDGKLVNSTLGYQSKESVVNFVKTAF